MAQNETPITIIGNVVNDPELRYTQSGTPVASFRVASTPRTFNKDTNQWEDGDGLFLNVNVWREMAENVTETLQKGMRAIINGNLRQRNYETREGERRTVYEIEAYEVGPSLRFASAQVNRNQRGNGNNTGGGSNTGGFRGENAQNWGNKQNSGFNSQPTEDPWQSYNQPDSQVNGEPPF